LLIDCSDDYLTGIDKTDGQHRELFAGVHWLYEDCLVREASLQAGNWQYHIDRRDKGESIWLTRTFSTRRRTA